MARHQHQQKLVVILVTVAGGLVLSLGGLIGRAVAARGTPEQPPAPSGNDNPTDDLQRSIRLDTYRIDADSGAARGENILTPRVDPTVIAPEGGRRRAPAWSAQQSAFS
jgi:hypothetical protein